MVVGFGREDEVGHRPSAFGIKRLNRTMIDKEKNLIGIAFDEERRYRAGCKIMGERAIARSGTIHGEGASVHIQVHDHFLPFVVGESDECILFAVQLQFDDPGIRQVFGLLATKRQRLRRRYRTQTKLAFVIRKEEEIAGLLRTAS